MKKLNIKSEFIRSIVVLTSGTALSQVINLAITPVLTRIYTPEEMGDFGLYIRLVGFLSVFATLRYELAIPLPASDRDAFAIKRFSLRLSVVLLASVGLLGVAFLLLGDYTWFFIGLYAVSILGSYAVVFFNVGQNWAIRVGDFKLISLAKVLNTGAGGGFKWFLGVLGFGSWGMILGAFIGQVFAGAGFIRKYFKIKIGKPNYSRMRNKVLIRRYKDFPLVSFPHAAIDVARDLILAFYIAALFSKSTFGYFNHSMIMLRIPLVLIGVSIGQVFFNRCSKMVNEGQDIHGLLKKTLVQLSLLSVVPFTVIYFFGEDLFSLVFGEEWGVSGRYAEIMCFWLGMNFINSPLSTIPMIINRQKEYFLLGLGATLIQILGFLVLPLWLGYEEDSFQEILWIVSITMGVYFVGMSFVTLYYSKRIKSRSS